MLAALLLTVAAVLSAACGSASRGDVERAADGGVDGTQPPVATLPTSTTTTTETPTTSTTEPMPERLAPGDEGPAVATLQARLAELGFRPGEADGKYGPATSSAVLAFQKHEGLDRDRIAGPGILISLTSPLRGAGPRDASPGPRIEIDLDRQVLFFIDGTGAVTRLNTSTGSGRPYRTTGGGTAIARTPTGSFAVYRRVDAVEHAPLGILYRPLYFTGGFAVHGSPSVPAYPASHGCVRLADADQDWLFPQAPKGTPVVLYAGEPVPEPDPFAAPGA